MTDYCKDCSKLATRQYRINGSIPDFLCDYCAGHRDGMAAGHERWVKEDTGEGKADAGYPAIRVSIDNREWV